MYEVGFGIDFYLEYFKFAPEFKATFGLVDMLVNDDSIYSSSIQKNAHTRIYCYINI